MPCRYLWGLISHLKAFPLFQEAFLGKSHTVQSSSWLHRKSVADRCMDTFFQLQMEPQIGSLSMYVMFIGCEVTMPEKPAAFNGEQNIHSSSSGSCYIIF